MQCEEIVMRCWLGRRASGIEMSAFMNSVAPVPTICLMTVREDRVPEPDRQPARRSERPKNKSPCAGLANGRGSAILSLIAVTKEA
jgi:hypothetical protein